MIKKGNPRRLQAVPSNISRPAPKLPGTDQNTQGDLIETAQSQPDLNTVNTVKEETIVAPEKQPEKSRAVVSESAETTLQKAQPVKKKKPEKSSKAQEPVSTESVNYQDFFIPITARMSGAIERVAEAYQKEPKDIMGMLVRKAHDIIKEDPSGDDIKTLPAVVDETTKPLWKHRVRNAHISDTHLEEIRDLVDPMGLELDRTLMARCYQRIIAKVLNVTK